MTDNGCTKSAHADPGNRRVIYTTGGPAEAAPPGCDDAPRTRASSTVVAGTASPTRIHEFQQDAMLTGDIRRAVLYAADQPEIDAYVVEIGPARIMLDNFLYSPVSRQRSNLLQLDEVSWFDYSIAARLLRPHEVGLEVLSRFVPLVRDRYGFFGSIELSWGTAFPQHRTAKVPATELLYSNALTANNVARSGLGTTFVFENLLALARTGKPTFFYVAPLNPSLRKRQEVVAVTNGMVTTLEQLATEVGARNIALDTKSLWLEADAKKFRDNVHLIDGQKVVDLAGR